MERVLERKEGQRPPREKMTYEEFLAWADEDTYAEWVNGEVIMVSPASARHQDITDFLTAVLRTYVRMHDLGVVISAPFQMKLAHSGREPDVIFIAREHLDRLRDTYLDGPADLVVEVISPESFARDRGEKFYEYEVAGIPEYWLIDPTREVAEFYLLEGEHYRPAHVGSKGRYESRILKGFWLDVEWLWQDPLPPEVSVLLKIAREDYIRYLADTLASEGEEYLREFLAHLQERGSSVRDR